MSSRVLFAGRDRHIQQMVADVLGAEQIQTACADDGNAALCLLNETLPDLLIAEVAMPGKDGFALCNYVRQEPEFQSLPVILLDRQFDPFNQHLALDVGADIYLSQPFSSSELVEMIRKFLAANREADEDAAADNSEPLPAATGRAPMIFDAGDVEETAFRQAAAHARSTEPAFELPSDEPNTDLLPPAEPSRRRGYLMFYAAIAAMLIGITFLILLRPQPGGVSTGVQTGAPSPSVDRPAPNGALATTGQPYVTATADRADKTQASARATSPPASSSALYPPTQNNALYPPAQQASAAPAQAKASAPDRSSDDTPKANNAPKANDAPKTQARQNESKPAAPAVAREGSSAPAARPAAPRVRPYRVRPTTIGGHWRRGGAEMVESGEHFGSGAKHFGKGSAKAASWAGKKAGSGIKRIGSALKRIF